MMAEEPCRRVDSKGRRRLRKSTQLLSSENQAQTLFVIKITLLCGENLPYIPLRHDQLCLCAQSTDKMRGPELRDCVYQD